jgi:cobalt-zinc-cadmium efflux system membrane fusion protein
MTNGNSSTVGDADAAADGRRRARPRRKRRFWVALLLVAGLPWAGVGCRGDIDASAANPPSTARDDAAGRRPPRADTESTLTLEERQLQQVKVVPIASLDFPVDKNAPGRIAFNEDSATSVYTPYTGHVLRLLAKPGEWVPRGHPLFEIDTPDLVQAESDLISAFTAVGKARNQLEMARRTAARQDDLYQAKAVAQKDWEQAQSDVRNAEHDLQAAEGTHSAARDRLRVFGKTDADIAVIEEQRRIDRITQVRSPIAGMITARKVGPGQFVKPDNPDPLFTIADTRTMWLLANVYETDIASIRVGQPVDVSVLAYPEEIFRARVSYIAPVVDPATHRLAVRAEVTNASGALRPEMFATFRIQTSASVKAAAVPVRAVTHDGDLASVWIKSGPREFTRRPVELGLEHGGFVQALSGVSPGEQVVVEGGVFLSSAGKRT